MLEVGFCPMGAGENVKQRHRSAALLQQGLRILCLPLTILQEKTERAHSRPYPADDHTADWQCLVLMILAAWHASCTRLFTSGLYAWNRSVAGAAAVMLERCLDCADLQSC